MAIITLRDYQGPTEKRPQDFRKARKGIWREGENGESVSQFVENIVSAIINNKSPQLPYSITFDDDMEGHPAQFKFKAWYQIASHQGILDLEKKNIKRKQELWERFRGDYRIIKNSWNVFIDVQAKPSLKS